MKFENLLIKYMQISWLILLISGLYSCTGHSSVDSKFNNASHNSNGVISTSDLINLLSGSKWDVGEFNKQIGFKSAIDVSRHTFEFKKNGSLSIYKELYVGMANPGDNDEKLKEFYKKEIAQYKLKDIYSGVWMVNDSLRLTILSHQKYDTSQPRQIHRKLSFHPILEKKDIRIIGDLVEFVLIPYLQKQ